MNRSYSGDPMDLSWKSGPWVDKNGETIDVTVGDEGGEERFDLLPSDIDPDDLTDTQRKILEARTVHPDASQTKIAELVDCTPGYVCTTLKEYTDYEPRGGHTGKPIEEQEWEDLTDLKQAIIDSYIEDPTQTVVGIADDVGCHRDTVQDVLRDHSHVLEARCEDLGVDIDDAEDVTMEGAARVETLPASERSYEHLTPKQQATIDYHIKHPDASYGDIADSVGDYSRQSVSNALKKYGHVIEERRNELMSDTDTDDADDDLDGVDELPESAQTDAREEDDLVGGWGGSEVAAVRSVADSADERIDTALIAAEAIRASAGRPETVRAVEHLIGILTEDDSDVEGGV